jgi:hypothetical protein
MMIANPKTEGEDQRNMQTCDYVHEAWGPNEGCKEFMDEPETFPCTNPAAVIHTVFSEGPDWPDYRFIREISTIAACDEHPVDLDDEFNPPPYGFVHLFSTPINGDEF